MIYCVLSPTIPKDRTMNCAASSGFGLVELMISVTISLIIMAGILTLYANTSQTNREMEKTTRQVENGSFAIDLLVSDISHGGFWETYVPDYEDLTLTDTPEKVPSEIPAPCKGYDDWTDEYKNSLLGIPLQSYDDNIPVGCEGIIVNKQKETDILVVRHADSTSCQSGVNCDVGQVYFQSSLCEAEDPYEYVLSTAGFIYHKMDCAAFTDVRQYVSNIYYIRDYYLKEDDGIPTLMRSKFERSDDGTLEFQESVALVEGVEDFRVELGIDNLSANDTDVIANADPLNRYTSVIKWPDATVKKLPSNRGDGVPDDFIHCPAASCELGQLSNVVAAKLYFLVRNQETSSGYESDKTYTLGDKVLGPFKDNFKRHVYATTIRLNNVAGRRETPP